MGACRLLVRHSRVLREFSDQTELATLSRSFLPTAGQTKPIESGGEAPTTSAEAEEVKRIQEMIKDSPDLINAANTGPNGRSRLQQAAAQGQLVVSQFLVANGADLEARGQKRKRMTQPLLDHGADANARDHEQATPLMRAVSKVDNDLVELLLAHKADVAAKDIRGRSPLHYAVWALQEVTPQPVVLQPALLQPGESRIVTFQQIQDRTSTAQILIAAGADVNARDLDGRTPLTWIGNSSEERYKKMASLLRQHGALDDLPRPDAIQVRRTSANYSDTPLLKGTNDWNRFTFLEILAMEYGLLTKVPQGESSLYYGSGAAHGTGVLPRQEWFSQQVKLPFPNLEKVRIRQPSHDLKSWQERTVDVSAVLTAGDCSKDAPVEWGDVVEVAEADHPLNQSWHGFSEPESANLKKCLSREIEVIVKGQATKVTLAPVCTPHDIVTGTPFWIKPALRKTNLLLISSDLSRVKVTRIDPASKEKREWVLDCSDSKPAPDFWLRDGDVIEVPDKN